MGVRAAVRLAIKARAVVRLKIRVKASVRLAIGVGDLIIRFLKPV